MNDKEIIKEAKRRFKICKKYEKEMEFGKIKEIIYFAGMHWGRQTPEEIIKALNDCGYEIKRKKKNE